MFQLWVTAGSTDYRTGYMNPHSHSWVMGLDLLLGRLGLFPVDCPFSGPAFTWRSQIMQSNIWRWINIWAIYIPNRSMRLGWWLNWNTNNKKVKATCRTTTMDQKNDKSARPSFKNLYHRSFSVSMCAFVFFHLHPLEQTWWYFSSVFI